MEQHLGPERLRGRQRRHVVAEAGISRSTFYAYFVDKTKLLRTWYAEFTEVILGAAQAWWSLDGTATKDELRAALKRIMDAYRAHPELMAATHEAIGTDHGVREAVDDAMRRYIDGLRGHIENGQAGGFIDPSLPAAETAYWLQWMADAACTGWCVQSRNRASSGWQMPTPASCGTPSTRLPFATADNGDSRPPQRGSAGCRARSEVAAISPCCCRR